MNQMPTAAIFDQQPPPAEYARICGELRQAIMAHDQDAFHTGLLAYFELDGEGRLPDPVLAICAAPFDPAWFGRLPLQIQFYALHAMFREGLRSLQSLSPMIDFLSRPATLTKIPAAFKPSFRYFLIAALLLQGRREEARRHLGRPRQALNGYGLHGWLHFLDGNLASAHAAFSADLEALRRRNHNPEACFTGPEGLFYLLTLLAVDNHAHLAEINAFLDHLEDQQPHNPLLPIYQLCRGVTAMLGNRRPEAERLLFQPQPPTRPDGLLPLLQGLVYSWFKLPLPEKLRRRLQELADNAAAADFAWIAEAVREVLDEQSDPTPEPPFIRLGGIIQGQEAWQYALKALETAREPEPTAADQPDLRLAWLLHYDPILNLFSAAPRLQRRLANGTWRKGRPVSLRQLAGPNRPAYLGRHDQAICDCIRREYGSGGERYLIDPAAATTSLIGHPYLFPADDPHGQITLVRSEPEIFITADPDGRLRARLLPLPGERNPVLVAEGMDRYRVVFFNERQQKVAAWLGLEGRAWPRSDEKKLRAELAALAPGLTIHTSLSDPRDPEESGLGRPDSRIILQLLPFRAGLRVSMQVRPFGPGGPACKPGLGPIGMTAAIHGQTRHLRRDLAAEEANAGELRQRLPLPAEPGGRQWEWSLKDPEECLHLLSRLRAEAPEISLEWPEGERLSVSPPAGMNRLRLGLHQSHDWFELRGSLKLDNGLVLDLSRLLELTGRAPGRFLPLGHGQFLALTEELRRKLDEIRAYAEIRKESGPRLHPLAAHLLQESAGPESEISGDKRWREFVSRLRESRDLRPLPPAGLRAELRDYQLEGYQWLARMAHLGLGACLADDMGLGKTVQTLALLLARAGQGPALVVAPTSVCLNWVEEARRFAPELKIILFSDRSSRPLLKEIGPGDLVITSYAMLRRETETLTRPHWRSIVLDEAQAIKNFLTKRSRAAMKLQGDFKLITTGTPVENHLGELWTLFRFINPGLLGPLERFNRRFAAPITRQTGDPAAGERLRRLIHPFILRRLKSEVLRELPPKTEITLQVEMSPPEAALYEALRRQALHSIAGDIDERGRPLKILAEIMKLRRACCHPRLVLPDADLPCAKLDLFGKVVAELLENRHRALVFSQFVDYLKIVREFLDQQGISYQYLDGRTPPLARQERVAAFQAGKGEIFLISLKAGGQGINLTAADYVIHLDPWWNPAVEDQAADRAHRIGQERPVTAYRLITTGTIEEKIRELHQHKKKLADDLLTGARGGHGLKAEELLALLTDTA